eukprot:jgi/Bigna1/83526/fgenesh1_pg.110_\
MEASSVNNPTNHKQLCRAILDYISKIPTLSFEELGIHIGQDQAESCEVASQCLTEATGISNSEDDEESLVLISGKPASLFTIFSAGVAALKLNADISEKKQKEERKQLESHPGFQKLLANLKAKGYFKGTEENKEAYNRRYEKVLAGFKAKLKKHNNTTGSSSNSNGGEMPGSGSDSKDGGAPTTETTTKRKKRLITAQDKAKAEAIKKEANKIITSGNFMGAVAKYTEAIELDDTNPVYFVNRAVAQYKLQKYLEAEKDCKKAIQIYRVYDKAWMRLGQVQMAFERYDSAIKNLEKALTMAKQPGTQASCRKLLAKARQEELNKKSAAAAGAGGIPGMPSASSSGFDFASLANNPQIQQMMATLGSGDGDLPDLGSMMSMFGGGGGGGGGGMPSAAAASSSSSSSASTAQGGVSSSSSINNSKDDDNRAQEEPPTSEPTNFQVTHQNEGQQEHKSSSGEGEGGGDETREDE